MSETVDTSIDYPVSKAAPAATIHSSVGKSTSPDDLLKIYEEESSSKVDKVEEEAEHQAKVAQAVPKKLAAQEIVKNLEEKPAEEEVPPAEEPAKEEEAKDSVVPKLKAKLGEEDVELPEDATFEVELENGKSLKFNLTSAVEAKLREETFNRDMDRRVGAVSHREKSVDTRIQDVLSRAAEISKVAASGDVVQAIKALAKLGANGSNLDSVEYEKQLWGSFEKAYEMYAKWSPEQRQAYYAERKAEEAQKETSKLRADRDWQDGIVQLDQRVTQVCNEVGVQKEKFGQLYKIMVDNLVGPGKDYLHSDEVTPEEVGKMHVFLTQQSRVSQAIRAVDENLLKDTDFVNEIVTQAASNPDWNTQDIEYVITQVLNAPSQSVQNLNRKLEKAKSQSLNSSVRGANTAKKEDSTDRELEEFFLRRPHREARSATRR